MTRPIFAKLYPTAAFPDELADAFAAAGLPKYRGKQVFSWIHARGIADPQKMSNLPKELRSVLAAEQWGFAGVVSQTVRSKDGTRKIAVRLEDGSTVETVLIPDGEKLTQCVSSQVGCAIRCTFCRSGCDGLKRNLTAAEIVAQVHLARPHHGPDERLRNVVFMGVGEPLHNTRNVVRAFQLLTHAEGLDLSDRRVTVSTVGVVRGIERLAETAGGNVALAISLHAANDRTRAQLVPGAGDSLADILLALRNYPLPPRRRFTIEYVLVEGINDSRADALELVKLLSSVRCKVNLLPLNPHDRTHLRPPSPEVCARFQETLAGKGLSVFLRKRRGDDINAACGQLLSF